MLSQETEEQLAEILVKRIEETNTFILQKIGEAVKKIGTLSPSQAYQISQILKYGGSYEAITKEIAKVSGKNVQDIYKIFDEVAKSNKQFVEDFYKYRGIDYIPYKKDLALQNQVRSIATITANMYRNISNTTALGFVQDNQFKPLRQGYEDIIDKAILSITQGKQDYYSSMRQALKELGNYGVVVYQNGYKRRLDSAARMNILDGIRQLDNETNKRFGAEYDADGIEISVHSNPAPDHADIQGRQFSNEQYEILEAGGVAKDYKGNSYDGADKRHISELNCYHKIFAVVLGVSNPLYTDAELKKIEQDNNNGFDFDGKHYTNYEGTQIQRRLETEIRRAKDTQILARASGDTELVAESQKRITALTNKYNDLCKTSGLLPKKQRMSVSGYRRVKVSQPKIEAVVQKESYIDIIKNKIEEIKPEIIINNLKRKKVVVDDSFYELKDEKFRNEQLEQLDYLTDRYKHNLYSNKNLTINVRELRAHTYATSYEKLHRISLSKKYYASKNYMVNVQKDNMASKWHYKVPEDKLSLYTITHEYGHILEYEYVKKIRNNSVNYIKYADIDKDLRDIIMRNAMRKSGRKLTTTEFKHIYWSRYAMSKRDSEWFAETFAKYILSDEKDEWTEAFGEWLEGVFR